MGYQDPDGHKVCPVQDALYRKYREEGYTAQEAFKKMREDLGLSKENPNNPKTTKFSNWKEMQDYYRNHPDYGSATKFVKTNKPMGSRNLKKWFKNGGTIEIADGNNQVWIYHSADGHKAGYVHGRVVFFDEDLHENANIAKFYGGNFTGDRSVDKQNALNYLKDFDYDEIPEGFVLHHDYRNGRYILVAEDIHRLFTHYGGHYYNR